MFIDIVHSCGLSLFPRLFFCYHDGQKLNIVNASDYVSQRENRNVNN